MSDYANDRHCTECIWHSETDGCWLWDCDQISRREAKVIVREWREAKAKETKEVEA